MIRENQKWVNAFNIISDGVLVIVAYVLAWLLRFVGFDNAIRALDPAADIIVAVVYSVLLVFAFYAAQMYGSYRFKQIGDEAVQLCLINTIAVLCLMAVLYLIHVTDFSRLMFGFFWLFSCILLVFKRVFVRKMLRHYRMLGYNQKHVVLVGCGHAAEQYCADIAQNPHLGFTVNGYFGDKDNACCGVRIGTYEALDAYLNDHLTDDVIVALDAQEVPRMPEILAVADKQGAHISIIPFCNDYLPVHPTIDVVGKTKLINMRATPLDNMGAAMLKRAIDVVGAAVLIVLSSPILLITAIGVKLSSPGPVLFRQNRVGKDKKEFEMLKFRSMRITGTENTGWSTNTDPRKTGFGSFIRKCSIDELPQLFNVLKGEMSLIGPRPEVPFHVQHFKEEIPLYLVRQQVRPGITGWAQVNGLRGDTSIEERVKYDIWYIENWSISLDIQILFRTAFGGMINNEKVGTEKHEETV